MGRDTLKRRPEYDFKWYWVSPEGKWLLLGEVTYEGAKQLSKDWENPVK